MRVSVGLPGSWGLSRRSVTESGLSWTCAAASTRAACSWTTTWVSCLDSGRRRPV